ncbi:MAG: hypothetical protein LJE84_06360 [Gammaproteobacteria bacterium]|jgi:hypothetical protein|nr:hypothetical protein [Gammaproteobacteria bacterium]
MAIVDDDPPAGGLISISPNSPYYGLAKFYSPEPFSWRDDFGLSWKVGQLLALGALSIYLYLLLLRFEHLLVKIAVQVQQGDHSAFLVPIVISLVFSLVHGGFTSRFWEVAGIQPSNSKEK